MRHIRTRISRAAHDRASRPTVLACVLVLMALPVRLAADPTGTGDQTGHKQIFGWIERVLVSDERVDMKAKLDTGAKTTSLHAVNIERFKRDGKRMVRFEIVDPRDGRQIEFERRLVRSVRIKEQGSPDRSRRPVVKLWICIGDIGRQVEVNLVDRSRFNYPLLIGRSALADDILVDSSESFTASPSCAAAEEGS